MKLRIGNTWDYFLAEVFEEDFYRKLEEFLEIEYRANGYTRRGKSFTAYRLTRFRRKAVIIGQDPYHQPDRLTVSPFPFRRGARAAVAANIFRELGRTWAYGCRVR